MGFLDLARLLEQERNDLSIKAGILEALPVTFMLPSNTAVNHTVGRVQRPILLTTEADTLVSTAARSALIACA